MDVKRCARKTWRKKNVSAEKKEECFHLDYHQLWLAWAYRNYEKPSPERQQMIRRSARTQKVAPMIKEALIWVFHFISIVLRQRFFRFVKIILGACVRQSSSPHVCIESKRRKLPQNEYQISHAKRMRRSATMNFDSDFGKCTMHNPIQSFNRSPVFIPLMQIWSVDTLCISVIPI